MRDAGLDLKKQYMEPTVPQGVAESIVGNTLPVTGGTNPGDASVVELVITSVEDAQKVPLFRALAQERGMFAGHLVVANELLLPVGVTLSFGRPFWLSCRESDSNSS